MPTNSVMWTRRRSAASILLAAVGLSCGDASRSVDVERVDSAGITIVRNMSPDRPLDWRLEEVLRIGGEDQGPEAFYDIDEDDVGVDDEDRIYVLDVGNVRIHVFGPAGEHLRSMSREGEGPGELESPRALFVSDEGDVHVRQTGRRLVTYSAGGSFDGGRALPRLPGSGPSAIELLPEEGAVLAQTTPEAARPLRPGDRYGFAIVHVESVREEEEEVGWATPRELVRIEGLEQPSFTGVGPPDCPVKLATPPVFTLLPVWHAGEGEVLLNAWKEYRVDRIGLDGRSWSVRRALPPVAATHDLAAAELGPYRVGAFGADCDLTAAERADQAGWEDRIPWVEELRLAPDGGLWVLRRAPGETPGSRIDVFAADGTYEGTLPPGFPWPALWRGPDEIVRLENDDLNRPYVAVYRVVRE